MAIDVTYKQMLMERYIQSQLAKGIVVTSTDLEAYAIALDTVDFKQSQFSSDQYAVTRGESASATKFNNTFAAIKQDLSALYEEMLLLSDRAIRTYERWNIEAKSVEKELIDLEDHVDNLLLLTKDTEGYFSTLLDNLTDSSLVDLDLSSCMIDLKVHQATLQPTGGVSTRIFLNNLDPENAVAFRVRSTANVLGRTDLQGSEVNNVFQQGSKGWWTAIATKVASPITCELDVKLSDTPISLSKICLELHDSAQSGPMQITPLYTVDKVSWAQLPTNTFSQEARTTCVFSFPSIQVTWVKFVLTKTGPDPSPSQSTYSYQFGFKEISFYNEGFTANTAQKLISKPLWVIDPDGNPQEFEKLALQVCERVETNTSIKYYLTTSNDPTVPITGSTIWVPISPTNYINTPYPQVISVGDVVDYTFGETELQPVDDEIVKVSYDPLNAEPTWVNPASPFILLTFTGDTIDKIETDQTEPRYTFKNNNEFILNYQLDTELNINPSTLQVFRNIGRKGLLLGDKNNYVRKILRGWGFSDPWYSCVIEILAPEGIEMDVGDSAIIIDNIKYTGKIGSSILTGKSHDSTGLHYVQVHKDNWGGVSSEVNTLDALKLNDPLYPYNHRFLIEGYPYGTSYPLTSPKVYSGVDMYAEYLLQEVGLFDFINNIPTNGYQYFTKDYDAYNTHDGGNEATTVFAVKSDSVNPDFQNERFVLRFKLINQLQKYLRLRADLITSDPAVTPALASYKIKLG